LFWSMKKEVNDSPQELSPTEQALVEDYLIDNISQLSPQEEVLGGGFYVTAIDFIDSQSCLVDYEDGHIALRAKVVFNVKAEEKVEINSFEIIAPEELDKSEINFSEIGNIVEQQGEWELVYEEPGSPALRVELVFTEDSKCLRDDQEDQSCFSVYWENGDRTEIKGIKESGQVKVKNLKIIKDYSTERQGEDNQQICVDQCGDGICQEVVCLGSGCPCPETPASCPQDCN
jgi:hypothetical protein